MSIVLQFKKKIFCGILQIDSKIHMEEKRVKNSKNIYEEKQNRRNLLYIFYYRTSHDSMVMVQRQI